MAGPGLTGEEILYRQAALIMKASGASESAIARNRQAQERMFAIVKSEKDPAAAEKRLRAILAELEVEPAPDPAKAADAAKPEAERPPSAAAIGQLRMVLSPWFRYFLTFDPVPVLRQVRCPVLAVNGEKDLQVPAKEDLRAIEGALKEGGNRDFTVKELGGLNHLFQTAATGAPGEYGEIGETIAPAALQVIGDWIVRRTGAR